MIELSCNLINTHPKQASPFLGPSWSNNINNRIGMIESHLLQINITCVYFAYFSIELWQVNHMMCTSNMQLLHKSPTENKQRVSLGLIQALIHVF